MRKYRTMLIAILPIIIISLLSSTALAITGNFQPEPKAYTGVVILFNDTARQIPRGYCSGFLLSPTVMVTAGHSLIDIAAVSVSFDKGPISYAIEDGKIVYYGTQTIYNGAPESYSGYEPSLLGNQEFLTSDIGIIKLDQPVTEVTVFPKLPDVGFTKTLSVNTNLQVVGYGFQYQTTPRNNGIVSSWTGTLSRNTADVQLSPSNFAGNDKYLKLSANGAQGTGGVAFGDSGGPVIYTAGGQDIAVGVNAFVSSDNCRGVSYHTRLDNQQVLDWINTYLQ